MAVAYRGQPPPPRVSQIFILYSRQNSCPSQTKSPGYGPEKDLTNQIKVNMEVLHRYIVMFEGQIDIRTNIFNWEG